MKRFIATAVVALTVAATPVFAQSADWQRQVVRIVSSKQTYPAAAETRGEQGTARVKVYVAADGAVEKTELVTGTGSAALDRAALALPSKAGKFPAPPGGATTIVLPLTWKLL